MWSGTSSRDHRTAQRRFRRDEGGAGAVVATSLVLVAVFVPVALFREHGNSLRQFALTIAFSVSISAFNALTLTPALSAVFLGNIANAPKAVSSNGSMTDSTPAQGSIKAPSAGLWTGGWRRCCSFLPCLAAPTGSISAFRAPSSRRTIKAT